MRTKAVRTDSGYVLNGVKRWITNAGVSKYYTVMAVTDPSAGANGISAFVLEDGIRDSRSGRPSTSSASMARRPGSCTSTTARSRPAG
jgi:alkylation response protein AidB-like acyl-CoA dehydrogenase